MRERLKRLLKLWVLQAPLPIPGGELGLWLGLQTSWREQVSMYRLLKLPLKAWKLLALFPTRGCEPGLWSRSLAPWREQVSTGKQSKLLPKRPRPLASCANPGSGTEY